MKKSREITRLTAVAVTILMIATIVLSTFPAYAQYTKMPDRDTQTEVGASPTLVGLGQSVIINIMTYPGPNGPTYEAQSLVPGLTGGFGNISVTITRPDGTKDTFMPIDMTLAQIGVQIPGQAQIVGHLQFSYKPDQIGNYSVTASFPGQTYTTDNQHPTIKISVYYKPSSSTIPCKFSVQQEPVLAGQLNGYPWSPLPKNYWRDPVSVDNREWAAISGDWTQTSYNEYATAYNPYSTAPNSPHILWSKQVAQSGLVGGEWGSLPYGGSASTNIILDGKFYQSGRSGYFECRDLYTGEVLWEAQGSVSLAQRMDPSYQTASQLNEGQIDKWLWGTSSGNWVRYNPYNGAVMQNITGAPTDVTSTKWENNSPIVWVNQASLSSYNKTKPLKIGYSFLIKWNYTKVTGNNWKTGIMWNISTLTGNSPTDIDVGDNNFRGPTCVPYAAANVVLVRTPNAMQVMEAFDYTTGQLLWKNNATVFDIDVQAQGIATGPTGPNMKQDGASPNYVAYDVKTGKEIWRAPSGEIPWGLLPAYTFVSNNGVFFHGSYDGHVYADRLSDGTRVWQSDYVGEEFETIYNNQAFNGRALGADGKLYYSTATTYSMMPRVRFQVLACINETTGKFLWVLPIGIGPTAVANGYIVGTDSDNGMQYCLGKGQTKTTVETPLTGVPAGTSVVIKGTVMDLSPGAPNTPAISDTDMSEWMDYLYGQNATLLNNPPKPDGVTVRLSAMNSDGDVIDIGTVTSDSSGMFKKMWTPQNEGEYTIYATFDGSESYWGSYAESALGITKATETPSTQQQIIVPDYTMTIISAAIAVIIAVAVATILIVRRK
ncbi:MAG TPA: PQQ-binding-like beta-propeller repeat protein [Candidatus Sulfotelmatobacter sp.]|nr:PQQ-binding-like beta-propeller repeat protein [Candidatus Sulfotelmatobacter sp.]